MRRVQATRFLPFTPPPLYRPSVFLVECSFPFPFFSSLKAEKEILDSDYDLSVLIFVFLPFLVLIDGCPDRLKMWDLFIVEFPLLKRLYQDVFTKTIFFFLAVNF